MADARLLLPHPAVEDRTCNICMYLDAINCAEAGEPFDGSAATCQGWCLGVKLGETERGRLSRALRACRKGKHTPSPEGLLGIMSDERNGTGAGGSRPEGSGRQPPSAAVQRQRDEQAAGKAERYEAALQKAAQEHAELGL